MIVTAPKKYRSHKKQFRNLVKYARDIKELNNKIIDTGDKPDDGTGSTLRQLNQLVRNANAAVETEKALLREMLRRVEATIENRKIQANLIHEMPTLESLRTEISVFLNRVPNLVNSPYPPLCGAIPFPPDQIIPSNTFVCVPNEELYILAYLLYYDPEINSYHVVDADLEATCVTEFIIHASLVVPLPTSSPARRTKQTNYPVDGRVLALWPLDYGWTSAFYPATVLIAPNSSPGVYNLRFDGLTSDAETMDAEVPERFVIPFW